LSKTESKQHVAQLWQTDRATHVPVQFSKSVRVGFLRRGWVTLSANFILKGVSSINHCWCQQTRVIVLLCAWC